MHTNIKTVLKGLFLLFLIGGLVFIYKNYNPLESAFFPKCPFRVATGLECPGCGSQRAVHQLLNFNLFNALKENLLLVISIPYLLLGIIFEIWKDKQNPTFIKWRRRLFGLKATYIILALVIIFWIVRNIIQFL